MTNINTIQETRTQLKQNGLLTIFEYAMKEIVKETRKPQWGWWVFNLSQYGLTYHHHEFTAFHKSAKNGVYDDFLDYFKEFGVKPASGNRRLSNSNNRTYSVNGLDFGCITWNLKSYLEKYLPSKIEVVSKISYECFFGMTAGKILQILNQEVIYNDFIGQTVIK